MDLKPMYERGRIRNGTAIAVALMAVAATLDAQRPATTRQRDSAVVLRLFAPGMSLDSLQKLVQEIDHEQYGTQRWVMLRGQFDSLLRIPVTSNMFVRGMLARGETSRQTLERLGWIGLNTQGPNRQMNLNGELFVTQFAYPLIVTVDPQSPAERAGITAGDVLVAYNGVDVVNHEFNLSTLLKPDSKVAVTVRREGEAKDFQLVVAKAPQRIIDRRLASEMPPMRRDVVVGPRLAPTTKVLNVPSEGIPPRIFPASPLFVISSNGVFGASVSTVNTDLARALNLRAGVLVNEVPEDSPAFRAGLRTGDVIIGVADQPVVSLTELRRALAQTRERAVSLQVTSPNQKPRTVTISLVPSP